MPVEMTATTAAFIAIRLTSAGWQMFTAEVLADTDRVTHRQGRLLIGGVAALAVVLLAPPAMARTRAPEFVRGRWGGVLPCVPTSVDPATNDTTCVGSTSWVGDLTGQTHYVFTGSVDLTTGAGHGTVDETFVGRDSHGRVGTLRFAESVRSTATGVPGTATIRIDATVVGASGQFEATRGDIQFDGTINAVAGDIGTFVGRLLVGERP